ncbi:MAG TPA: PHB depolymerase family esterase [Byssovorax sp.]
MGPLRSSARAVAGCLAAGALAPALFAACHAPSDDVDAGDLLGVFSRDGGAERGVTDAGADGGARRTAKKKRDGGADTPAAPVAVRAPIAGSCLAAAGEPDKDISRVLGRPACRDAQIFEWKDALGSPRYACLFAPRGVEARAPLPIVLFFHGGLDDPTMVDKKTSLRKLLSTADLTGDPAHKGFLVLAVQGRHIQGGRRGSIFDVEHTGAGNVDVETVDHFFTEVDAKHLVDPRRVYTLGAQTGGQMAALYAMTRPDRVAAFGAFAAEPLSAKWSCGGPPTPAAILYRACDFFTKCDVVEEWRNARDAAGADTRWLRLGAGNDDEPNCAFKNKCSEVKGTANHRRWPKGKEDEILKFFAKHALAPEAQAQDDAGAPGE